MCQELIEVYFGCGHFFMFASMDDRGTGFSFDKNLRQPFEIVGTLYLWKDVVCEKCKENPEEMSLDEQSEECEDTPEEDEESDTIAFPADPYGVGERIRESSEPEEINVITHHVLPSSEREVVEQSPIIPDYSTWMVEKGLNSEEAQSILSMPSPEFLCGKLGIIEASFWLLPSDWLITVRPWHSEADLSIVSSNILYSSLRCLSPIIVWNCTHILCQQSILHVDYFFLIERHFLSILKLLRKITRCFYWRAVCSFIERWQWRHWALIVAGQSFGRLMNLVSTMVFLGLPLVGKTYSKNRSSDCVGICKCVRWLRHWWYEVC